MPAVEEACRHHVEWLELLVDPREYLLQVGQHRSRELVHQKGTRGVQDRMGGSQDAFPELSRHRGVRNPREHIVGVLQIEPLQGGTGISRRSVHNVQPLITDPPAEKLDEVAVRLERNQNCIRAHPAQNLSRERAHPGTILEKDASAGPIHFRENMIDQKT
jgi:hypothetical protein